MSEKWSGTWSAATANWSAIRKLNNAGKHATEIVEELKLPISAEVLRRCMRERGMTPNFRRAHQGTSKLTAGDAGPTEETREKRRQQDKLRRDRHRAKTLAARSA